jgi:hypothetical protein
MSASEIARILPRIDEERQLPKQRQRRPAIPFDMHRAGETVEAHALRRTYRRLLTHRMKAGIRKNQPTAVFRSWVAVPAPPRLPQRQPIRGTCRLRAVAGGARLACRLP